MPRSILVHLDASAACAVRLNLARQLARQHDASVTALFAVEPGRDNLPTSFGAAAGAAEAARHLDLDGRHSARKALEKSNALGSLQVGWREVSAEPPLQAMVRHALFADLLVLGKRNPTGPRAEQLPPGFAEAVIIASGRPALVVPDDAATDALGHTVVIAWKPAREAARAVAAALPLLQRASTVHVLMWQEAQATAVLPQQQIHRYLQSHGVTAQIHTRGPAPARVGEAIVAEAQGLGANLLVMGCYGRSRARELVLGGASRSVLQHLSLPVLMAH